MAMWKPMSNKSSPRSTRTKRRPVKGRVSSAARRRPAPAVPETWQQRLRHYFPFIGVVHLVVAMTVFIVCFTAVLVTGARLSYLPGAAGAAWLAVHGAPLRYDGVTLGMMPLLPTVGVVVLTAVRVRAAIRKRVSVADLAAIAALVAALSLTLSAIALFMVWDASKVYPLEVPPVLPALAAPMAVHVVGLVVGMGPVLWKALARRYGAPPRLVAAIDSARGAARLAGVLLASAAVVFLVLLGFGAGRLGDLLAAFPQLGGGGKFVLLLLGVLYLPNAAVETLGVLLGGHFSWADGSASLFAVDNVAFPPFPLFAAIPGGAAVWAPALMLVPAAALVFGVFKGWLVDVLPAAIFTAAYILLAALFAGGAAGAYGHIGVNPFLLAGLALLWGIVAGAVAWGVGRLRGRGEAPETLEGEETAEDTEDTAEDTEDTEDTEGTEGREPEEEPEQRDGVDNPAKGGSTKWVPPEPEE